MLSTVGDTISNLWRIFSNVEGDSKHCGGYSKSAFEISYIVLDIPPSGPCKNKWTYKKLQPVITQIVFTLLQLATVTVEHS